MNETDSVRRLTEILRTSRRTVFLGGAGVSTESGIPDFRSAAGIYTMAQGGQYTPEEIISHSFFLRHPVQFYDFYRAHFLYPDAKPNRAHRALARLETAGMLSAVITQNVDGLHQAAGSRNVYELHGSVHRNTCLRCGKSFPMRFLLDTPEGALPRCPDCGGLIKPDVVLYEESLNEDCLDGAVREISRADTLLIGGTSLAVYPAAGLTQYFSGRNLVILNMSPTPQDKAAQLLLSSPIGQSLGDAADALLGAENDSLTQQSRKEL